MNNSIDNLYKKGTTESTPIALDNLILNQAKQSCKTQAPTVKPKRWVYSLATAAVFVMGFTVIFNLQDVNQDMQATPQAIEIDKKTRVEFKPDNAAPNEPHYEQRGKKRNTPANLKEKKNTTRQYLSVPTITAPIPSLEADEMPMVKMTDSDSGLARDNTVMKNSVGNLIETNNTTQIEYNQQDEIVVAGSSISRGFTETNSTVQEDIKKLENLITHKHFTKAKELLNNLKEKHPNYDFSELESLIKKLSN